MGFANPWGLLALLAIPAVLAMHKLRRRLAERRVAGLFLWAATRLAEDAGRTVSPLLRTASLALELTAAALLSLLLAGPVLGHDRAASHLVVVLDDTASMGARMEGATVAQEARSFLSDRMADLGADGLVTLVLSGHPPAVLAGPRSGRAEATEALARWRPVGTSCDLGPALDLALDLAAPGDPVLLVTDEAEPEVPPRVEVAAFGKPQENVALSSARRFLSEGSASEGKEILALDLTAYARVAVATEVRVTAGEGAREGDTGRLVAKKAVVVEPGAPLRLTMETEASDAPLRVTLVQEGHDALAVDDEAILLPETPRVVPYAVAMADAAAKALGLDRLPRATPGVVRVEEGGAALVFTDAEGAARSGVTRVVVSAGGSDRDDWLGPFLVDKAHGLAEGLTLEGVVWSAGKGTVAGRGLVFAGDQTLMAEEVGGGATVVRLNLDPARSTLAASADWPILLSNLVERARAALPGRTAANARVGETLVFRTEEPERVTSEWRFVTPAGAEEAAGGRGLLAYEPREPGVFRLVSRGAELARWAVAFVDGRESDLSGRGAARRPPKAPGTAATATVGDSGAPAGSGLARRILAVLLLIVVAADAWVLARRRRTALA